MRTCARGVRDQTSLCRAHCLGQVHVRVTLAWHALGNLPACAQSFETPSCHFAHVQTHQYSVFTHVPVLTPAFINTSQATPEPPNTPNTTHPIWCSATTTTPSHTQPGGPLYNTPSCVHWRWLQQTDNATATAHQHTPFLATYIVYTQTSNTTQHTHLFTTHRSGRQAVRQPGIFLAHKLVQEAWLPRHRPKHYANMRAGA